MPWIPQDARFALKLLARQRGFTAAALMTLALCIGANTAIFSVLNAVILRPLPFEGAERLVRIYNSYPRPVAENSRHFIRVFPTSALAGYAQLAQDRSLPGAR
jgi:hypothetical protein